MASMTSLQHTRACRSCAASWVELLTLCQVVLCVSFLGQNLRPPDQLMTALGLHSAGQHMPDTACWTVVLFESVQTQCMLSCKCRHLSTTVVAVSAGACPPNLLQLQAVIHHNCCCKCRHLSTIIVAAGPALVHHSCCCKCRHLSTTVVAAGAGICPP